MAKARGVSLFTVAVLADIHGNLAALEAVLRDLATVAPDRVVVAGDLVFNGPRPREVVEAIQSLSATVLRGNTDELVVRASAAGQHVASWTRRQLLAEHLDFLAALPFDCRIEPAPGQTLA
ncbi:MAG: metallophosphoesterase, partial [Clostridia bacterium]|nr:metallophosphoesterase [Clostridia bacterium]